MDLPATIYANAQGLPVELQREALDFITSLMQRQVTPPATHNNSDTEAFIKKFAGCLGDDFPDEITSDDLPNDCQRGVFE
jgi:Protein of unknown function (DUF2281)